MPAAGEASVAGARGFQQLGTEVSGATTNRSQPPTQRPSTAGDAQSSSRPASAPAKVGGADGTSTNGRATISVNRPNGLQSPQKVAPDGAMARPSADTPTGTTQATPDPSRPPVQPTRQQQGGASTGTQSARGGANGAALSGAQNQPGPTPAAPAPTLMTPETRAAKPGDASPGGGSLGSPGDGSTETGSSSVISPAGGPLGGDGSRDTSRGSSPRSPASTRNAPPSPPPATVGISNTQAPPLSDLTPGDPGANPPRQTGQRPSQVSQLDLIKVKPATEGTLPSGGGASTAGTSPMPTGSSAGSDAPKTQAPLPSPGAGGGAGGSAPTTQPGPSAGGSSASGSAPGGKQSGSSSDGTPAKKEDKLDQAIAKLEKAASDPGSKSKDGGVSAELEAVKQAANNDPLILMMVQMLGFANQLLAKFNELTATGKITLDNVADLDWAVEELSGFYAQFAPSSELIYYLADKAPEAQNEAVKYVKDNYKGQKRTPSPQLARLIELCYKDSIYSAVSYASLYNYMRNLQSAGSGSPRPPAQPSTPEDSSLDAITKVVDQFLKDGQPLTEVEIVQIKVDTPSGDAPINAMAEAIKSVLSGVIAKEPPNVVGTSKYPDQLNKLNQLFKEVKARALVEAAKQLLDKELGQSQSKSQWSGDGYDSLQTLFNLNISKENTLIKLVGDQLSAFNQERYLPWRGLGPLGFELKLIWAVGVMELFKKLVTVTESAQEVFSRRIIPGIDRAVDTDSDNDKSSVRKKSADLTFTQHFLVRLKEANLGKEYNAPILAELEAALTKVKDKKPEVALATQSIAAFRASEGKGFDSYISRSGTEIPSLKDFMAVLKDPSKYWEIPKAGVQNDA